ncbi:MAG: carbohydrate ABC transporter permease [Spirochaetota bacterium]
MKLASLPLARRAGLFRLTNSLVLYLLLATVVVLFILPYIWMLGSAFKPRSELFANVFPVSWKTFIPLSPTLDNMDRLINEHGFLRQIWNTLLLSAVTVTGSVLICSMMGFVLGMLEFPGRKILYLLIMFTLMLPFETRMIPTFLVVQDLGLANTFTALYLPWLSDAFLILLFANHFSELPSELYNAAIIDGCPHWRILWSIMLPNITPSLVSGGLIKFFFAWDSYVWPLIILRSPKWQVIGVGIASLFTDQSIAWELIFAGSLLSTIPVIILFFSLQRHYVAGMSTGGSKE